MNIRHTTLSTDHVRHMYLYFGTPKNIPSHLVKAEAGFGHNQIITDHIVFVLFLF